MITNPYFKLSVLGLSETDTSENITCKISNIEGKKRKHISFPFEEEVQISCQKCMEDSAFVNPVWYIQNNEEIKNSGCELTIDSENNEESNPFTYKINATEALSWAETETPNTIFENEKYSVIASAKKDEQNILCTLTLKTKERVLEIV